jgi:hypothetical protein
MREKKVSDAKDVSAEKEKFLISAGHFSIPVSPFVCISFLFLPCLILELVFMDKWCPLVMLSWMLQNTILNVFFF